MSAVRDFLCGIGLAASLTAGLPFGNMTVQAAPAPQAGFVTTSGTHFVLDGQPFYFQGTNAANMAIMGYHSEAEIYKAMNQYAAHGIRVVRLWGFSCQGEYGGESMVTAVDATQVHYDEPALQHLDATFDAARAAGIKLILPLVNFEPAYCGIGWWVHALTGSDDKQLFYKDDRVKSAFKRHVATMLNRVNTRYQTALGKPIRYLEDPTLMAIEVMNEPHTQDGYDYSGELVYRYLAEMTDYIRSIDTHHLICSGEEGYKTTIDAEADTYEHTWINNGLKGVNFTSDIDLANIDFGTTHMYPDNWDIHSWEMPWIKSHLVQRRADLAHAANKPIVMEESGFSADASWHPNLGFYQNPDYWLRQMYDDANAADYAGTMIWELLPSGYPHGGYDYTFDDPVGAVVFAQAKFMNSHN